MICVKIDSHTKLTSRNKMINNVEIINHLIDRIKRYKSGKSKITDKCHKSDVETLEWYKKHLGENVR